MLYLKDTSSPQEYDQAIFRLQSQNVREFKDADGKTIKINLKPQTLLVDFDPNRMFNLQVQKSLIYNANVEVGGNNELSSRIERELKVSPIFRLNSNSMQQVEPSDIMEAVSKYSSERSAIDEATDRAYRIGQNRNVTVYHLIAKDTIEERILDIHRRKQQLFDQTMSGSAKDSKLSSDDILHLLGA